MRYKVVAISGSVRVPSRTTALVAALAGSVALRAVADIRRIDMATSGPALLRALTREQLDAEGLAIVEAVETAHLLVVGTPVYRAGYTGVLKHLFDLVDNRMLAGKVALLAATGGSPLHGLVTEFGLRPLLSYFGAVITPTSVYATEDHFAGTELSDPGVRARVERAADEAVRLLGAGRISHVAPLANIA